MVEMLTGYPPWHESPSLTFKKTAPIMPTCLLLGASRSELLTIGLINTIMLVITINCYMLKNI